MKTSFYLIHALSPLHCSSGRGVGYIDLPIMRETSTGLPLVPGSSLKGVLRDRFGEDNPDTRVLFGPEKVDKESSAGCCCFGDALLCLLPVRSLHGVFAWATCPLVLQRLKRDADISGAKAPDLPTLAQDTGQVPSAATSLLINGNFIVLEDFEIAVTESAAAKDWARWFGGKLFAKDLTWQSSLEQRFVVLPDQVFFHLAKYRVEVQTHIRIDDKTKTVIDGALWTVESLPAESVLWGLIQAEAERGKQEEKGKRSADELLTLLWDEVTGQVLQLGGNATTGQGRAFIRQA